MKVFRVQGSEFRVGSSVVGAALVVLSSLILPPSSFAQGPLTPAGPPAATMKTLEQVEPRTPITNLPVTILAPGSYYLVTNLTGSAVRNCVANFNTTHGIQAQTNCTISGCTARGNTINYDLAAGNRYGPIIDITAGGTAAVSGDTAASTVATTDPWANFSY